MIVELARSVCDGEFVGVGTLSPLPLAALALARRTNAPKGRHYAFFKHDVALSGGTKEFFDLAQRGDVDLFFLSGAQISERGDINLSVIGEDYNRPRVRLPGGAGSAMLYECARRVVLFSMHHDKRTLVKNVDFVTARGTSAIKLDRLVTPLATFAFDGGRFVLDALRPDVGLDEVVTQTGFPVDAPRRASVPIDDETRALILRVVVDEVRAVYPQAVAGF